MESSFADMAANQELEGLDTGETSQPETQMFVDDGGHALLDLIWPMPIGLLVMGSVVAAFFGLCSMLR